MSQSGGYGSVTSKNNAFGPAASASEAVLAVPNADGSRFWVITYKIGTPDFYAYEFDADGPTGYVRISTSSSNSPAAGGCINLSPDGSKIIAVGASGSTTAANNFVKLFTFNANTGDLFENWTMSLDGTPSIGTYVYGADFSPSGRYLYLSGVGGAAQVFRYDLQAGTTASAVFATETNITALETTVANRNINTGGQVRRGPDGKMYVARYGQSLARSRQQSRCRNADVRPERPSIGRRQDRLLRSAADGWRMC